MNKKIGFGIRARMFILIILSVAIILFTMSGFIYNRAKNIIKWYQRQSYPAY